MINTTQIQYVLVFLMAISLGSIVAVKAEAEQKGKDLQTQESGVQWK